MHAWNWARITGNTIAVFATAAIAINLAGAPQAILAAFYAAGMTALLAFAKELQEEGKQDDECPSGLAGLLLF